MATASVLVVDLLFFDLVVLLLAPPDVVDVGISLEGPGRGSSKSIVQICNVVAVRSVPSFAKTQLTEKTRFDNLIDFWQAVRLACWVR